jgi:hypothetical protein
VLRLRISSAFAVGWFFLFYNIERINEPFNIASFVYVLAPLSAFAVLSAPGWLRGNRILVIIVPVLAIYAFLKIWWEYPIGGQALPVTITEVCGLLITILVMHQLAGTVHDFEDGMAKLTFRQIGLPPRLLENIDTEDMYREVKRSRRFQHPLALLIVDPVYRPDGAFLNRMMKDLERDMAARYIQARLAKHLSEEMRDVDLIAQHQRGFALVVPETTVEEAQKLAAILKATIDSKLGMRLRVGIASFPENALTLGGLLDYAEEDLKTQEADAAELARRPVTDHLQSQS